MNVYLISDTHFNHQNIATYCQRPKNFTEIIIRNWQNTVHAEDTIIHLGDVQIGQKSEWVMPSLPGRKILVRGNHDREKSCMWWMEHGFDFACDSMIFRGQWLTHEPAESLPKGCMYNIHGHLHNIWHGFGAEPKHRCVECDNAGAHKLDCSRGFYGPPPQPPPVYKLKYNWQRLFAIEYTDYKPIEFDKFVSHPKKYLATGLGD